MANILYVCEENNCRSAVAKVLTEYAIRQKGISGLNVDSSGLDAKPGTGMSSRMKDVLSNKGYNENGYSSRQVTRELLLQQDYILCMSKRQLREVLQIAPEVKGRTYTLPGVVGFPSRNINHPSRFIRPSPKYSSLEKILYSVDKALFPSLPAFGLIHSYDCIEEIKSFFKELFITSFYPMVDIVCAFLGVDYRRNEKRYIRQYKRTAGQIKKYVDMFLDKLIKEGKVSAA